MIWCTDEHETLATERFQTEDILTSWTNKWSASINTRISMTSLFTLSTKHKSRIHQCKRSTLKGRTTKPLYRTKLSWNQYINKAETKVRRMVAI